MKNLIFSLANQSSKNIFALAILLIVLFGTSVLLSSQVFAEDPKIPNWVRNVVKWWADGQVSDGEFIKGMRFLVENKIMDIDLPERSTAISEIIDGQPSIQTDKSVYNSGDEIKISGSGFESGDIVIVIGNFDYISLLDNYSRTTDWSNTDFNEFSVLIQYQYSDSGNGTWQKRSYPSGFAISTKVVADANGAWQTTLKNYQSFEKNSAGNIEKQNQLPPDQYIIKAAQKNFNKYDSFNSGYKTLVIKTTYSYITVQ